MKEPEEKKPARSRPKKRVGFWRNYFAWFMAVMGADPGYRPWEAQKDEDDGPPAGKRD
jgi:hypothetical protein